MSKLTSSSVVLTMDDVIRIVRGGIQVVQSLVHDYRAYETQNSAIANTIKKMIQLPKELETLYGRLMFYSLSATPKKLLQNMDDSIQGCGRCLLDLNNEYNKVGDDSLACRFQHRTLQSLERQIDEIASHVSRVLQHLPYPGMYHGSVVGRSRIRLLGLVPSLCNSSDMIWYMFTTDVGRHPEYDALSYEWGEPEGPKENIQINDTKFSIGINLWHALSSWASKQRGGEAKLCLWVDAICINQSDTLEKNGQVAIMGDIYRIATAVQVWLGGGPGVTRENCQAEIAFALLEEIWKLTPKATEQLDHMDCNETKKNESPSTLDLDVWKKRIASFSPISARGDEWQALASILQRKYWSRMWIIQEFVLANKLTINFGTRSIDGAVFQTALGTIAELNASLSPHSFTNLKTITSTSGARLSERRRQGRYQTLMELLETSKSSQCTLFHDKVYALLGIATDVPGKIPVDYTRSMWQLKLDVGRCFTNGRRRVSWSTQSRICSVLDEIFPDCEE